MIFKKIYDFLANAFSAKNIKFTFGVIIVALLFFLFKTCDRNKQLKHEVKREKEISAQNYAALTDQIKMVDDKLGQAEYTRASFLAKIDDLAKLNKNLAGKIEEIKGDVISIIDSKVGAGLDSIVISNELVQIDDITYGLAFKNEYEEIGFYSYIEGMSKFKFFNNEIKPDSTEIFKNNIKIGLTYGFKELDDRYEIFAKSPSNKVTIDELEGALIIKKDNPGVAETTKKRFGLGPNIGLGYGFGDTKFRPSIGIGLQYNVIRF